MKFNPNLQIRTRDLLSHHDVVMRAPVCDPMCGLPLGDGNTGSLLWFSDNTLHIQINNTDFIDDIREGEEYNPVFDELITICRNGGTLNIEFPAPVFETIYQKTFEARLSLPDATAMITADTPFAKVNIKAFASGVKKVTAVTVDAAFEEEMDMTCRFNRWGSRSLTHPWAVYHDDNTIGLDGTDNGIVNDCLFITQKLHGNSFCMAVKVVASNICCTMKNGCHEMKTSFTAQKRHLQTYYIAAATAPEVEEAKEKALQRIREAVEMGMDAFYAEHTADWADFWDKSYISLPDRQDFLENLWYLNLYYSNCMMRGEYPYLPWSSIWSNYHDYTPWSNILHWNSQVGVFPLDAANHSELADTYFRFSRAMLENAENYARKVKKKKGAFFVDLCDLKGRMDMTPHYKCEDNCSVGAHLAMEMYQYYRFTGNEEFLKETALPVMRGAAEYYLDELVMGEDGYYHILGTSAYEAPMMIQDDTSTDLAAIRALFAALIPFLTKEEAAVYQERLDKLVPFHYADFCEGEVDENGCFLWGIGKGQKIFDEKVMVVGTNPRLPKGMKPEDVDPGVLRECKKKVSRVSYGDPANKYYSHPDQELFSVFPSGLYGIKDKGTEMYKRLANCIYLHPERDGGWCRILFFLARMGMEELLDKRFDSFISERIVFPQGISADYEREGMCSQRWHKADIYEQVVVDGKRQPLTNKSSSHLWNFRYFNFEGLPIIAAAANEMLIQSYDGIIRLFPAILPDTKIAFKLAAIDGRMVEAVFDAGECEAVITCQRGGTLLVTADHVNGPLVFSEADTGKELIPEEKDGIYVLDTQKGDRIRLKTLRTGEISVNKDYSRNMDVKYLGEAKIGWEKEFR